MYSDGATRYQYVTVASTGKSRIARTVKFQNVLFCLCFVSAIFFLVYSMKNSASYYIMEVKAMAPISYEVNAPLVDIMNASLAADDPKVLKWVQEKFLYQPSKLAYNLSHPENLNPSMGQAQVIDQILDQMRNGVYIECGALDGETRSNTLFFEKERGWKGLLIEADPSNFEKLLAKNRRAYSSPACLSPSNVPTVVEFQPSSNMGHIVGKMSNARVSNRKQNPILNVQCFPVLSFIRALNFTTIDYFSLDVEGAEYSVLKGIPWEKVDIKVLSIEYIHDAEGKHEISQLMESNGYVLHSEVKNPQWLANDFIYVRKDIYFNTSFSGS